MGILWKGRPSVGQCKVQFPSNLFECQNRYYFFFPPSSSSSSLDSITASIFCFFALYIYFSFSNNSNRPRCCELFKFNQLFLFPLPPLWMMPHLVFRLPLRFGPSYRTKINLIPQFRLLVHARCVNATMLVEMYILFETRDPVVLLLFKYVNHGSTTQVLFFLLPHFHASLICF